VGLGYRRLGASRRNARSTRAMRTAAAYALWIPDASSQPSDVAWVKSEPIEIWRQGVRVKKVKQSLIVT